VSFTNLIKDVLPFPKIIFTDPILTIFNLIELLRSYRALNYFLPLVKYSDTSISTYILKKYFESYLERASFAKVSYRSNIKLSIITSSNSGVSGES
jgi:hypothetical protein